MRCSNVRKSTSGRIDSHSLCFPPPHIIFVPLPLLTWPAFCSDSASSMVCERSIEGQTASQHSQHKYTPTLTKKALTQFFFTSVEYFANIYRSHSRLGLYFVTIWSVFIKNTIYLFHCSLENNNNDKIHRSVTFQSKTPAFYALSEMLQVDSNSPAQVSDGK